MDATSRLLLVVGWLLVAFGVAWAVSAGIRDEGVNSSGVVRGVGIGLTSISVGAYALMAASLVRTRQLWWVLFPATLTVLVVWSAAVLVTGDAPPVAYARGEQGLVGLVVFMGYFALVATPSYLLLVLPAMLGLAWLADQVPALRRRGVGDAIRRRERPPQDDSATAPRT
jgi:hypothetical protein